MTARRLVHLAFFASGAASLTCEVVWFKLFGLAIGNTTQSASLVVAVFFVGLGLGAVLAGRLADRTARPLRLYGALELGLAVASAATTLILVNWAAWVGWMRPWLALEGAGAVVPKLAIATALLLVPTIGMGSTLPVLTRFVVGRPDEIGARVAALYAVNTLGASVGCAFVGFFGIAWWASKAPGLAASALYAVIGAVALVAARDERPVERVAEPPLPARVDRDERWLVVVFAATGFVAVGYEVVWFRLLATATVNTVYVFATLLAVYLLGLVLGAQGAARLLARSPGTAATALVRVQLGVAIAGTVALAELGRARTLLAWLGGDLLGYSGSLSIAAVAAVVLLPPCVVLGFGFPLASQLASSRLGTVGSRLGLVYGANTVAGALGSLATGFVLIPRLGSQGTVTALIVGNLAALVALLALFPALRSDRSLRREALLTVVVLVALQAVLGRGYLRSAQTLVTGAEVVDFRETADGTFLLVAYEEEDGRFEQVIVNGTSYANNRPPGRNYMALLAHLPILLHDDPEQVVVICVGTGTTVGAASIEDRVDRVTAVDLSPEIFALAPHFVPWNHSFFASERVRQIAADGRHFLLVSPDAFDVLTFEPPPPLEAGVANLYTVEFYRLARGRARPGALVAQWIPFHQGFQDLQKQLVRSALEVFPHVSLWLADNQEGLLIGSDRPLSVDPAALAARMAEPDVATELHEIGVDAPEDLLALFLLADDDLRAWAGPGPAVTDDRPTVERFLGHEADGFSVEPLLAARTPLDRILTAPVDPAVLARSVERTTHLWRAADRRSAGDPAGATAEIDRALALDPASPYYGYRAREARRAPGTEPR